MSNRNLFISFIILLSTFYFLLSTPVLAHDPNDTSSFGFWTPGDPIVDCGRGENADQPNPCNRCELLHLLRHLVDMVLIFILPVVGTLFFIVAGVMMMLGGDNPGMLSQGKRIFKDTFIGIIIVLMAWLITNTLIQTFAKSGVVGERVPGGSGESSWWTFSCTPTISTP